jgi:hypothetical protein
MSQPSSQTTGYRQYADMSQKPQSDPDMGIYSVCRALYHAISPH